MENLQGRIALITGGARGLGAAIGRCLANAGVCVCLADIDGTSAGRTAEEVRAAGGVAHAFSLDVGDERQAAETVERIEQEIGPLDILVNNAATDVTVPIEELAIAEWDRIMRVNLRGPFVMSKLLLPLMRQRGRGHIVNVASTAGKRAWPNASAYHASKWGLLGFSHALHTEARPSGVKVTALVAGGMRTPFLLERFPDIDVNTLQDPANVAEVVRFVLTQPNETVIPEVMVLPMTETSWP